MGIPDSTGEVLPLAAPECDNLFYPITVGVLLDEQPRVHEARIPITNDAPVSQETVRVAQDALVVVGSIRRHRVGIINLRVHRVHTAAGTGD